jgi:hypothetical protein
MTFAEFKSARIAALEAIGAEVSVVSELPGDCVLEVVADWPDRNSAYIVFCEEGAVMDDMNFEGSPASLAKMLRDAA